MPQHEGLYLVVILLVVVASSLVKWRRNTGAETLSRWQIAKAVSLIVGASAALTAVIGLPWLDQPRFGGAVACYVGTALIAVGLYLNALVARALRHVRFAMEGFGTPDRLVITGPFAVIRHPSSVGIFLLTGGWFLAWRAPYCLYTALPIIAVAIAVENELEERNLERVFGDEFRGYKERVGRYVPRFGNRSQ